MLAPSASRFMQQIGKKWTRLQYNLLTIDLCHFYLNFLKILEKLYADKLDKFISTFKILNNSQYGFRSNCSTSMALMELLEEITNSIDNKKSTIGVFIDLKKAFDTINHGILIKKLEHYGIRGTSNSWIKSYLTDRHQYVCFNGLKSDLP